jgi:hypothetical protein
VLRAGLYFVLRAAAGVMIAAVPAYTQGAPDDGTLSQISIPGGLRAALAAIDDRAAPDRSQFLLEFIRRTYDMPVMSRNDRREAARRSLVDHLDLAGRTDSASAVGAADPAQDESGRAAAGAPDTLPLPLTPAIWIDVVFGGRASPHTLVQAIAGSRDASLLYYGLMSLDDDTRAWLVTQPQLIADLAGRFAASLVVAAPGLRVGAGAMRLPGGSAAEPVWEALAGQRTHDPVELTRALLAADDGALAYFLGAIAQLTPAQIRFVLGLDASDAAARVASGRQLYAVFDTIAWKGGQRAFWRPSLDPARLVAELAVDDRGQPILPGTRAFWTAVFATADPDRVDVDPPTLADGSPVDFRWLCGQVFKADTGEQRRRYDLVLFASHTLRRVTPHTAHDAVVVVRAAGAYPALIAALARAKLDDIPAFARAAHRAARLSTIDDRARAWRAQAQFQGALSLVTRLARRGGLPPESLSAVVSSLAAVDLNRRGEYEGRLVRWLAAFVDDWSARSPARAPAVGAPPADASRDDHDSAVLEQVAGEMDRTVVRMAAGPAAEPPRFISWEGTRYRIDLATGEAVRMARLLGEDHPPYLSAARGLIGIADALGEPTVTREALVRQSAALEHVAQSVGWETTGSGGRTVGEVPDAYRETAAALRRMARDSTVRDAARLVPALSGLADDLLGRGLADVAYAGAMGQPDRIPIPAGDAARRHEFQEEVERGTTGPWQRPVSGTGTMPGRGWHVAGSLLGLDVTLADFALIRLSSKPPSKKPTMTDEDRRVMTVAAALVEPAALADADRDTLVDAIRKGRNRLAAVRTPIEAAAIAEEIRLAPIRRSLLPWIVAHDPGRLAPFLSPTELFWLGLETRPVDPRLDPWGASAEPRLGCLCVQLLDRRPWETFAGRWNYGLLASTLSDLNLRLAELLRELQMPAPLLAPVLAAATADFTENATSRDPDDRRGPVEFVQALGADRVEQYLALLTTDGPLRAVAEDAPSSAGAGVSSPGAAR